uniref:Mevalonate kinase n=1 Tax=Eptatretus burgeri TaxID=7764 RepID=A0A8C4QDD0_EPTBU
MAESGEVLIVSAPGKIILHGEHSVVYGKTALAASIGLRTRVRLRSSSNGATRLHLASLDISREWPLKNLSHAIPNMHGRQNPAPPQPDLILVLRQLSESDKGDIENSALLVFLFLYTHICSASGLPALDVHIESELPPSAGLGSSAAYCTSLAAALLTATHNISHNLSNSRWQQKDLELINKWAFQAEILIHGNPSGIDNTVSTFGGALSYQSGHISELKSIPPLSVLLTNTNIPRSTSTLVSAVKGNVNKFPDIYKPLLDSMGAIAVEGKRVMDALADRMLPEVSVACNTLESKDDLFCIWETLIDVNQQLLMAIGVGHPCLEQICRVTRKHGLHSKLTGAGGGGCCFTVVPPGVGANVVSAVRTELVQCGFVCWETDLGGPGVCVHAPDPAELHLAEEK